MIIKNQVLIEKIKNLLFLMRFLIKQKPKPLVIFCHGYKGFKDWGAWNLMAEAFRKQIYFLLNSIFHIMVAH